MNAKEAWKEVIPRDTMAWRVAWRGWKAWRPWWVDVHDLHGDALLAMHLAAMRYDPDSPKGARISTYMYAYAWGAVRSAIFKKGVPVDIYAVDISDVVVAQDGPESMVVDKEVLRETLAQMPYGEALRFVAVEVLGLSEQEFAMHQRAKQNAEHVLGNRPRLLDSGVGEK